MKKVLAIVLLGIGFASQVAPSDYDNRENEPGYGQGCNCPTPSPKTSPRNDDSNDKK